MTVEITPSSPAEFWGDDETPPTGHRPADLSHADGREPLEDTPTYLRRVATENKELRATIARLEKLADRWERTAGPDSSAWRAYGPQVVSVEFAVAEMRRLLGPTKPGCYCGTDHA